MLNIINNTILNETNSFIATRQHSLFAHMGLNMAPIQDIDIFW